MRSIYSLNNENTNYNTTNQTRLTVQGPVFDMPAGEPRKISLVETMADKAPLWAELSRKHSLKPHPYQELVAWPFGDYVFGWDIPHGPYEYPDGCEVFIVYMGDPSHVFPGLKNCLHPPQKNVRSDARHPHPTGFAVPTLVDYARALVAKA